MNPDVKSFFRILDFCFHLSAYRERVEKGPLSIPSTVKDKLIDCSAYEITDKTFNSILRDLLENTDGRDSIAHIHYQTSRNWTRAVNGVMQGGTVLCISLFMLKKGFFINLIRYPLVIGSFGWGSIGARHLQAAEYTKDQHRCLWNSSDFIWDK